MDSAGFQGAPSLQIIESAWFSRAEGLDRHRAVNSLHVFYIYDSELAKFNYTGFEVFELWNERFVKLGD